MLESGEKITFSFRTQTFNLGLLIPAVMLSAASHPVVGQSFLGILSTQADTLAAQGTGCTYNEKGIWCGGKRLERNTDRFVTTMAIAFCFSQQGLLSRQDSIAQALASLEKMGISRSDTRIIISSWQSMDPALMPFTCVAATDASVSADRIH